jgi:hypothetical protein
MLNKAEKDGLTVFPAGTETKRCLKKIWTVLSNMGKTNSKPMPQVFEYSEASAEVTRMGFWCPNTDTIYINANYAGLYNVMLEECAHYITRESDGSRVFQQFAFDIAGMMMSMKR